MAGSANVQLRLASDVAGATTRAPDRTASAADRSQAQRGFMAFVERLPSWVRWTGLLAVLLAATWPLGSAVPQAGLDSSWKIGLALAFSRGLVFGRDIIFTYGPLGFTTFPLRTSTGEYLVALAVATLVQVGLLVTLLACLRRTVRLPLAVLATFVLASLLGVTRSDPLLAVAFGAVVLTLTASPEGADEAAATLAIGGGALAALAMLVKLNDGTATVLVIGIGLAGTARRRSALTHAAASFVVALVALWLLVGQPLGALPGYFDGAYQVVRGYVDAMDKNEVLGAKGVLDAGACARLGRGARRWRMGLDGWSGRASAGGARVRPAGAVLHGVPRDVHARGRRAGRRAGPARRSRGHDPRRARGRAAGLAAAAVLWSATFLFYKSTPVSTLWPLSRVDAMATQIWQSVTPAPTAAIKRVDALPASVLAAVRGHCVTVEANEIAVVWAYGLRWCPLPALQSYNAYTPRLDHLDAAAYASTNHGPDRVLRQLAEATDGRNPKWESPAAMLSLLCHFREVARGTRWQALARVPDRCGPLEPFATLRAGLGQTVAVPPAPVGDVLVAEVDGLGVDLGEHLASFVTRVAKRYVLVNGHPHRVPPDTASDGLLIGVPTAADYGAPFELNMAPRTIEAAISGRATGSVTVRLMVATIR